MNLIIVDDEETTRNSLMELVPWSKLGVSEVRTAANGAAALALVESFKPSILLTDIRMPKMNGIELAQHIRKSDPECEIIFLSGFSDKQYLKSAIQLNAVDYLDKPVDLVEFKALFVRVVQKLRKAAARGKESIIYERQEIVLDLIYGRTSLSECVETYSQAVVELTDQGNFIICSALIKWDAGIADDERTLIKHRMLKLLNEKKLNADTWYIAGFINDNCLAVVINYANIRETKYKDIGESLLKLLEEASSDAYSLSVGSSYPSSSTNEFTYLYKTSLEAAQKQFYYAPNKVFFPNIAVPVNYEFDKSEYTRFKIALRNGAVNDAVQLIQKMTEDITRIGDPDMNKIRNLYFNFLRILFEVTMQWDAAESGDDKEMIYMWREIDTRVSLKELAQLLISNIELVLHRTDNRTGAVDKIDEIKKYIEGHFSNNQLSIQSIAQHTFLSPTYLCAYFKKSTGRKLNEYITELRIEKAKELLRNKKLKIYEITDEIGLTDTNYFSSLFKKHTGLTPSEYRMKQLYDEKNI